MCVFEKVHCLFCKLEYSSVRACFRRGPLCLLQARVLISPCGFSTSSIVPPGLCSVQSAWFSGKFCSINFCSKAGGTTLRHSGLILVLRAVGNRCKMTLLRAARVMVCDVPGVWKKCQNRNLCFLFANFDSLWSQINPLWSQINPLSGRKINFFSASLLNILKW